MNSDLLVELAQLGLDGDKNKLINYLKNLAARSADERKLTLYKKISELLEDYESSSKVQWQVSGLPTGQVIPIRGEDKLWFPKRLEDRIGLVSRLLADQTLPEDSSIIFIDEFDAFAKSRFDSNDVGELKRIVNSLIQTLDMLPSNKIVIVATNLVETIDPAIARRFPIKVHVGKLNKSERMDFINFLVKQSYIPIKLSKKDLELFDAILRESDLKTVDAIKGVIDSSIVSAHVEKAESIYMQNIAISMLNNRLIDSDTLKRLGSEKPDLYAKLIKLFSIQYTKTDVAEILGMHRNSLLNYGKEI